MSAETAASDAARIVPGHLAKTPRTENNSFLARALTDREWYCEACGARITRSPDGDREYGHQTGCDHIIDFRRS